MLALLIGLLIFGCAEKNLEKSLPISFSSDFKQTEFYVNESKTGAAYVYLPSKLPKTGLELPFSEDRYSAHLLVGIANYTSTVLDGLEYFQSIIISQDYVVQEKNVSVKKLGKYDVYIIDSTVLMKTPAPDGSANRNHLRLYWVPSDDNTLHVIAFSFTSKYNEKDYIDDMRSSLEDSISKMG